MNDTEESIRCLVQTIQTGEECITTPKVIDNKQIEDIVNRIYQEKLFSDTMESLK